MMELSPAAREATLAPRTGVTPIILDTDTKNEIDDQFAVVYALLSDRIECQTIYAAPFANSKFPQLLPAWKQVTKRSTPFWS